MDAFLITIWLGAMLTKIALFYYAGPGLRPAASLEGLPACGPAHRVILVALSILSVENTVELPVYLTTGFPPFAYLFEWGIPFVLLLIAAARGFTKKY